ncbi:MAG: Crp/Fnr family transcriptional regulator [Pseudonocardia sp.]
MQTSCNEVSTACDPAGVVAQDGAQPPAHRMPETWPSKSFLGRLTPTSRADLLTRCRPVNYPVGEHLLSQGSPDRHAIVLLSGMVKVHLVDAGGFEALLAVRRHGDMVGELAALSGEPRTASVVAVNAVRAGIISETAISDFLATHPNAARELILVQGERLNWANRRRVDFAARSAESKIAHVLADLAADADEVDGVLRIELTQQDVASIVGVALNTAQGALRSLATAGLVERHYRAVFVPDLDRLVRFAEIHQ